MTESSGLPAIEVYRLPTGRDLYLDICDDERFLISAAQYLQECFDDLLCKDELLSNYIHQMQSLGLEAVIFGGWARDRLAELINNRHHSSRDIDLVTHGSVSVEEALPSSAIRNPFGGFGTEASSIHLDSWDLPKTFLIRRHRLPVTFEQLPLTADYNVNAVVFKPMQFFHHASLLDSRAVSSLQTRVLDFVADEVAQPLFQAARAIILAVRLQCVLSDTVRDFLLSVCNTNERRQVVVDGIRTYCILDLTDSAITLFESVMEDSK